MTIHLSFKNKTAIYQDIFDPSRTCFMIGNTLFAIQSYRTSFCFQWFFKVISVKKPDERSLVHVVGIVRCAVLAAMDSKIVSEYDQEIPQSQTADKPMAS